MQGLNRTAARSRKFGVEIALSDQSLQHTEVCSSARGGANVPTVTPLQFPSLKQASEQ
jgi:hypothetical protein